MGVPTDFSGYGQANRNFIAALYHAGVELTTEIIIQVAERGSFGWTGELAKALENREIPYKIKIIHLTPDTYPRYMEGGKYHIGHLFYETNTLPKEWVEPCNRMDEIWTASEEQAKMMKDSGVRVPIYCFPQPIDIIPAKRKSNPYLLPKFKGFVFYSIFQWIERKNPHALITNYWKAFKGRTDVALVLKTYRMNYSDEEFETIKSDIRAWKMEVPMPTYPRIFLIRKLMTTDEVARLHNTGDCYINTSHGEGWCIPAVEAALAGKPIISINKTGFADYFPRNIYYPCDTREDEVIEVPHIKFYKAYQKWLEIDATQLTKHMKDVYNKQQEAAEIGEKAQEYVVESFNYWKVGRMMAERLAKIESELK